MSNYNAYNLGISSALPLPELQAAAGAGADVVIRLGHIDWSPAADAKFEEGLYFQVAPRNAWFCWPHVGKFQVRNGNEIIIDPLDGIEERILRLPLLGTVMAVLLHQRGHFVLHASAVSIDGEAVVFLGNKGHGKSTMAATLYGRGHQLLADDVVALTSVSGRILVVPGFPQFKLYPEAVEASLGDDHKLLPELAEGYEKRGRPVTDRFAQNSVPLKAIYALGLGSVSALKPMEPQTALRTIIANSYMARFGKQLLSGAEASAHLAWCAQLTTQIPVQRLERPNSLALLPSIAQLVEGRSAMVV